MPETPAEGRERSRSGEDEGQAAGERNRSEGLKTARTRRHESAKTFFLWITAGEKSPQGTIETAIFPEDALQVIR